MNQKFSKNLPNICIFDDLVVAGVSSVGSNGGVSIGSDGGGNGSNISSLADVGGGDGLAGGDGDEVLNIGTVDLGDDVAVLNLDGDNLDGGVIHAVLGGDGAAGVLHGSLNGVSDGGGDDGGNMGGNRGGVSGVGVSSGVSESTVKTISVVSIGISVSGGFGIGFTLGNNVSSISERGITENISGLLAERHILNLFGVDGDGVADVLSAGNTVLGGQDLVDGVAVGGGGSVVGHRGDSGGVAESVAELGIGLGISISARSSSGAGHKEGQDKNLHGVEIVDDFPRCRVELK